VLPELHRTPVRLPVQRHARCRSSGTPEPPSSTPSALRIIVIGAIGISSGVAVYRHPTTPHSASIGLPSFASCPRLYRIATRYSATGGATPSNQRTSTGSSSFARAS